MWCLNGPPKKVGGKSNEHILQRGNSWYVWEIAEYLVQLEHNEQSITTKRVVLQKLSGRFWT